MFCPRENWGESQKKEGEGRGRGRWRGRKETLADFVDSSFEKGCLKNDEKLTVVSRLLA